MGIDLLLQVGKGVQHDSAPGNVRGMHTPAVDIIHSEHFHKLAQMKPGCQMLLYAMLNSHINWLDHNHRQIVFVPGEPGLRPAPRDSDLRCFKCLKNQTFRSSEVKGNPKNIDVSLYSRVLILAFISLDRYLAVVCATDSRATGKLLVSRVIYVRAWLPAAILIVLDLVFTRVQDVQNVSSSGYPFAEDRVESIYRIYPVESDLTWMVVYCLQHILVGFVLPRLVLLICYCIIISSLSLGTKGQVLKKKKALKKTVILVVCFFACWLPYCLGIFVDTLTMLNVVSSTCEVQQAVETWISVTKALAYFHCCLNPLLYAFLGVKFNQTASSMLVIIIGSGWSQKAPPLTDKGGQISSSSSVSTESSGVLSS